MTDIIKVGGKKIKNLPVVTELNDDDDLIVENSVPKTNRVKWETIKSNLREDLSDNFSDIVVKETVHGVLLSNWFVIPDKENYSLAAVYSLRDDAANYVQGIQRRSTGGYTVLVNGGTNGAEMDFLAVWIKNGGFSSGGTGEGGGTDIPVTVSGNYHLETKTVLLSYASPTLLRGYALFNSKIISAAATIEDRQNTPVLQTENVYTDVGYAGTETRVEIYAKGANYVSGHILAVHVLAVLEGTGGNQPGTGGDCNCPEITLPTPDKTLTESGGYADAAATGEAIGKINDEIFSNVSQSNLVGGKKDELRYHGSADFQGFKSYVEVEESTTITGLILPIKPYGSTAVNEITILIYRNDEEVINKTYNNLNINGETEYAFYFDNVELEKGDILGYGFLCSQPIGFYNSLIVPSITSKYLLRDSETWEEFLPSLATDRIYASFLDGRNKFDILEKEMESLNNKMDEMNAKSESLWSGKTGNFLGDSITSMALYTQKLTEKAGIVVNNYGVGGTTYSSVNSSNPFYSRVSTMSEDCDFIFAFGGTNDWGLSVPIGNPNDTEPNTFYGGLNATFSALRTKFPTKPIFVGTILQRNLASGKGQATGMTSNANGDSVADFNKAIKRVAERYGCIIFDGHSESGIICENLDIYMSDGLHLNDRGAERYAQFILDQMGQVTPY